MTLLYRYLFKSWFIVPHMCIFQAHAPLADMYSIRVATGTGERQLEVSVL